MGKNPAAPWRVNPGGSSSRYRSLQVVSGLHPGPAMFEPGAFAAGAFSVPPKGPSGGGRCHAFVERFVGVMHGRARGGMFAHANPTIGIHTPAVATLARPRRVPSALAFGDPRAFSLMALPAPGRTRAWAHEQQQQLEELCGG